MKQKYTINQESKSYLANLLATENLEVQMHKVRKNERDDHINQLIYNLGTIEHDAEQSPSIQLDAFRGKLSGSTTKFYSSDNIQTSSVPQIDLTLEYEISVADNLLDAYSNNFDIQSIGPFEDGSRLIIKKQDPLLRIKETNAFDEKENFHITAYRVFHQEVASGADNSVIYEKMRFAKREQRIMHDLYVGEQDIEPDEFSVTDIPYYFEILVDKEIAESDYCATIGDLPIRNIYLDDEIICPDQQEDLSINIYQSQVRPEDLEDCD